MEQNIQKKIEAVLFTVGKRISIEEIKKLASINDIRIVKKHLKELKDFYEKEDSSLRLIDDGEFWKMSVKEEYGEIIEKIVTETELSKSVMETLAVIAWQHPTLQAEVVRIRTNKAYEDIKELEEQGFITRSKHGRTKKINLTDKFFTYFDLPEKQNHILKTLIPEEVKDKINITEKEIGKGEKAIEKYKIRQELQKEKQEQLKTFNDAQKEIHLAIESIKE